MSLEYWVLDGHGHRLGTREEWSNMWGDSLARRIGGDEIGDCYVSTVFLGIDHGYRKGGPPILYETMVFWNGNGEPPEWLGGRDMTWRYATYEEAEAGHQAACIKVMNELGEPG